MIDFNIKEIVPLCEEFGLSLDQTAQNRLNAYGNLLLSWNEKMNLTAIREPREVLYKHFYDCLLFFKHVEVAENARVIDVGTGAGFPGLVLKIARPDIKLTLLDGLQKRLTFLDAVLKELGLDAETVHLRAEDGGKNPKYREQYDIACARAVAALPVLSEYCIPFVKVGGQFVAMKGASAAEEATVSEGAYKILGCEKPTIICENLRENEARAFIVAKKISQTPPKYPRMGGKIAKAALK
ncbi:MAG: 16S rRNA (guanine(527)-N(7))-methyltransferase RsmG [Clostridia bacterium]|nr:16S rRNA (guanine(527)-N(7))-methyltransferase RsmG [Clostridia bacterium]